MRAWALAGSGLAVMLAVSWWEILFLPLGDSHDGRIHGRFGLQVRNLLEGGLVDSSFLSSMEPFATQPYAHHPPLTNVIHATIGWLFGIGEWQLHLPGFLAGLATVGALIWLLRELGLGSWVAVGATGLVASTPMFWIYARLGLGISLMLGFLALWVRRDRLAQPDRWLIVAGAATAFASWPGAALVVVVGVWGRRRLETRRLAGLVLTTAAVAIGVTLLWALTTSSFSELTGHTADRVRIPVTIGEFVDQYRWFYQTLYPAWFRWSIPFALAASVVSPRTRLPAVALAGVMIAWTVALPEAAFVHDFWTYPLIAPIALGWAAILDWLAGQPVPSLLVAVGVGVLVLGSFASTQRGGFREAYFHAPSDGGALVRSVAPADGQEIAWVLGSIEVPRWLSYYWDLPTHKIEEPDLDSVPGGDRVLLRLDRTPAWLPAVPAPEAQAGRYVVVRASDLQSVEP